MATEIKTNPQSIHEVRTHFVDFARDLPEGVTVASAAATHTPPSGDAAIPDVNSAAPTGLVAVTIGPLEVLGMHYLDVLASLSDGESSSIRLLIPVIY